MCVHACSHIHMFMHLLILNLCLFVVGFETEGLPCAVWPGGETEALTRLERHLERKVSRSDSQRDLLLTSILQLISL